jgi:SAM-dependent methyltransferase
MASDSWEAKLRMMEDWYSELAEEPAAAARALVHDYHPHVERLNSLEGRILDIGGGAGLAACYLTNAEHYVVLDPSRSWDDQVWIDIRRRMSPEAITPQFVRGKAEKLPFGDGEFDAVLSMWSFNHFDDPPAAMHEIDRVLRRGGTALIVLEDMIPGLGDLAGLALQGVKRRIAPRSVNDHGAKLDIGVSFPEAVRKLKQGWPLQDDHVRISEGDIARWISGRMKVIDRSWRATFLTLLIEKT